jgi:hypothetical protein
VALKQGWEVNHGYLRPCLRFLMATEMGEEVNHVYLKPSLSRSSCSVFLVSGFWHHVATGTGKEVNHEYLTPSVPRSGWVTSHCSSSEVQFGQGLVLACAILVLPVRALVYDRPLKIPFLGRLALSD